MDFELEGVYVEPGQGLEAVLREYKGRRGPGGFSKVRGVSTSDGRGGSRMVVVSQKLGVSRPGGSELISLVCWSFIMDITIEVSR